MITQETLALFKQANSVTNWAKNKYNNYIKPAVNNVTNVVNSGLTAANNYINKGRTAINNINNRVKNYYNKGIGNLASYQMNIPGSYNSGIVQNKDPYALGTYGNTWDLPFQNTLVNYYLNNDPKIVDQKQRLQNHRQFDQSMRNMGNRISQRINRNTNSFTQELKSQQAWNNFARKSGGRCGHLLQIPYNSTKPAQP